MDAPAPPRYRIEHRAPSRAPLVLLRVDGAATAVRAADIWRARLRGRGVRSRVVVVDRAAADEPAVATLPIEA